jgi:hypothetical protein
MAHANAALVLVNAMPNATHAAAQKKTANKTI